MSGLANVQQNDADRLWKSQLRVELDTPPTVEIMDTKPVGSFIDSHYLGFIVQLHQFFLAHLYAILREQEGQPQQRPHPLTSFLKYRDSPLQSCLEPYARLALVPSSPEEELESTNLPQQHVAAANSNNNKKMMIRLWKGRRIISLHYEDFVDEFHHFMVKGKLELLEKQEWQAKESFGAFLYHKPQMAFACMGTAMSLASATLWRERNNFSSICSSNSNDNGNRGNDTVDARTGLPASNTSETLQRFLDASKIQVRVFDVKPRVPMMDIKTGTVGKLITVKANVVKVRPKRLRIATADFTCNKCGAVIIHAFDRGKYSVPSKCVTVNCKSRSFHMVRSMAHYSNVQEIRLQESQEESTMQTGRQPRQMPAELADDLVDSCRPGDTVLVACIVDTVNQALASGKMGKRAKETSTYTLTLIGHSVTTLSETSQSNNRRGGQQQQQYSQHQLQSITQLCHADHKFFGMRERMAFPFDLLVRSLCPAIIGHHEVKAGILLCLLGGTPSAASFTRKASSGEIRSNSHILVVGDPGMGKSQMLLAASQLAARSVYVGGNTASTTGLTVTMTKEEGGQTGMEAGALVLADNGICCIDEFDKMAKLSQDGLLEAMEQQQVSIAKAGVVASLPARCSVIAAANPKHGSYSMNKTVAENLSMSKPILSRFDLVFILRDRADQNLDRLVSSNIMDLYRSEGASSRTRRHIPGATPPPMTYTQQNQEPTHPTRDGEDRIPIWERLAWVADFQKEPLPCNLVRDYIAYAREYCKPKLTQEAAAVLQDYYMQLRYPENGRKGQDTVPITTRQLEAMIRLSQARAKACLREFVLEGDALDVVELMRRSVDQVHSDEQGSLDRDRGGAGGQSKRKLRKQFEDMMKEIIGVGAECSLDDLRCIADRVNFGLGDFRPMIDDLREKGVLLLNSDGRYKIVS